MFWKSVFQNEVLKVGMPNVGFKPFVHQGEPRCCKFHPNFGCEAKDDIDGETLSQPLLSILMWVFFLLPNVQTLLRYLLDLYQRELFHLWSFIWCVCGRT